MEKILVTGATGYIGRHVVNEMFKEKLNFISTDYFQMDKSNEIPFIKKNIFDEDPQKMYTEFGFPKKLLHMAWKNGFIHNDTCHMEELSKHYSFIRNMIELGVTHICIMGSMHEVGYYEGEVDENTPTNPMSQYAIAKNALRQSIELLCKDKGVVFQWIRGFYIFGDDEGGNSIFAKLHKANMNNQKTFPFTTGKNKYDFLSVQNLAKQIVAVVSQDKINGIINCCSGKAVSLADQIEWYIRENGFDIKLEYGVFPDREYDSPAIWGNNFKINKIMKG